MIGGKMNGNILKDYSLYPGGIEVGYALKELRENFARGNYLSVILLGGMIIERQLVGRLRAQGWNASRRMKSILAAALSFGFITGEEKARLTHLRHLRNAYLHFRDRQHGASLLYRGLQSEKAHEDIMRQDASLVISFVERNIML